MNYDKEQEREMEKRVEGVVKKNPWGDWDDVDKGWHIDGINIEDIISSFRDKKVKLVIEEVEVMELATRHIK